MGSYLDNPIKEKHPEAGGNENAWWGICGM